MITAVIACTLMALIDSDESGANDVKILVDTIDSLQRPVEDFRCEFEGAVHFYGTVAKEGFKGKVDEDGLYETFSGVFIWRQGGDTYCDTLNRTAIDNTIARETLVVRARQHQAELYRRHNDAPLGYSVIKSPKETNSWRANSMGYIFLIDTIKRNLADEYLVPTVYSDDVDGRSLKVLAFALKNAPGLVIARYWIDLNRCGHVVRAEGYYAGGRVMSSRLDVELASFKIGNDRIWMPVSGTRVGYVALENKKPVVVKEPTSRETIKVVDGTMEFNRKPQPDAFTIKYKPGTPISDHLKKLTTEFGQQKIGIRPTKSDTERMLNEQVALANAQRNELVVAPLSEGFDWLSALLWTMGALVAVSLVALLIQNRRH